MAEIALLVLNWNGAHLLRRHLPAVVEAARRASVPTKAYVIDNASEDDSRAVVREFEGVEWVQMPANLKLLAYNDAAREIECRAFMMLNNDLSPPPDAVDTLLATLDSGDDIFAVGGLVKNVETGEIDSGPTTLRWEREWIVEAVGAGADVDHPVDVAYVSGGAGLFRRDVFLELGGFWPLLPSMYWEDTELGLRAWLHGWRSVYDPRPVFEHETGATTSQTFAGRRREFGVYRNRRLIHVSQLLHGRDLRDWLKGEVARSARRPYLWPAALSVLPRLPAALRRRRALRKECGKVTVRELQARWSEG